MMSNFLAGNYYDWNDAVFRTGLNQDYNASISGASGASTTTCLSVT